MRTTTKQIAKGALLTLGAGALIYGTYKQFRKFDGQTFFRAASFIKTQHSIQKVNLLKKRLDYAGIKYRIITTRLFHSVYIEVRAKSLWFRILPILKTAGILAVGAGTVYFLKKNEIKNADTNRIEAAEAILPKMSRSAKAKVERALRSNIPLKPLSEIVDKHMRP